ncbi:MAG: hypothetical protein JWR84_3463 [Caulobacter sp.]|nr:hypothetical protein [Caulobacter sp.]
MAKVRVHIGSETDDNLRRRLNAALGRLGARRTFHWWGLGGSQEITQEKYRLPGGQVMVETETYVGITLIGDEDPVTAIQDELGA